MNGVAPLRQSCQQQFIRCGARAKSLPNCGRLSVSATATVNRRRGHSTYLPDVHKGTSRSFWRARAERRNPWLGARTEPTSTDWAGAEDGCRVRGSEHVELASPPVLSAARREHDRRAGDLSARRVCRQTCSLAQRWAGRRELSSSASLPRGSATRVVSSCQNRSQGPAAEPANSQEQARSAMSERLAG